MCSSRIESAPYKNEHAVNIENSINRNRAFSPLAATTNHRKNYYPIQLPKTYITGCSGSVIDTKGIYISFNIIFSKSSYNRKPCMVLHFCTPSST